jgi:general secretion pathway protein G
MPLSELTRQRTKETHLRRALRDIRDALDAYKKASDEGRIEHSPADSGYPPTLEALVDGVIDLKSASGAKIFFLRSIPRDPMQRDETAAASSTWTLRSYESPPDEPKPGRDVFDVHSTSDRIGLNGVAYSKW